jgi:hypothetical protein
MTKAAAQTGADSRDQKPQVLQPEAGQLFELANQARAADGAGPLKWDPALAAAALQHCFQMAASGRISHRYPGEAELTDRAGEAGAHFSIIEENIAAGTTPTDPLEIHQGWLDSPGHRANLLSREVDSAGIAVVVSHGITYAVADYSRAVLFLTQAEVESRFAVLLRAKGLSILKNPNEARAYCAQADPRKGMGFASQPHYRMLWQNPDTDRLPEELLKRLAAGSYRQVAIGSCPPHDVRGEFTVYRVAVLLY